MTTTAPLVTLHAAPRARSSRLPRVVARAAAGLAAALVLGTAAIGFLHTPSGRPLLMKLAGVAGCPLGKANAAEVDQVRRAALAKDRGATPAPARPAAGFELDTTTAADVRAWRARAGVTCSELRDATVMICRDLPAAVTLPDGAPRGALTELSFGFSLDGRLTSVATLQSHRTGDEASRLGEASEHRLVDALGSPHERAGSFAARATVATLSYRYTDYAADVTASDVPGSGFVVRESFMSAR